MRKVLHASEVRRRDRLFASCAALCAAWVVASAGFLPLSAAAADETTTEAEVAEGGTGYDPFEGMDKDGRIPAIDKAALVDHPERWRYLPESRIPPGNVLDRWLVSSVLFPIFFFNSDVGAGFGAGIADIDFRKQRRREFLGVFASYSTEGQQSYSISWRRWLKHLEVPSGGVLQEERSFVRFAAGYRNTLTRRFFGIGPTTNQDDETSYTDQMYFAEASVSHSLEGALSDVVGSLGVRLEGHWLSGGEVSGDPITQVSSPTLFANAERTTLGWVEAGLAWDTRDSVRNPYRGHVIGGSVRAALLQGDTSFQDVGAIGAVYSLFASKVFALPPVFHDGGDSAEENPPTDTLGFALRTELSSGSLPFFARPTLGGSRVQRGFIAGRWRDDALWSAAAEYRFWIFPRGFTVWENIRIERLGGAFFYEAGGVGEDGLDLFGNDVVHSYGFGGRAMIERAVLFRLDLGFSGESFNLAAGFGTSF